MDPDLGAEIEALEGVILAAAQHVLLDADGEPVPYAPDDMERLTTDISRGFRFARPPIKTLDFVDCIDGSRS